MLLYARSAAALRILFKHIANCGKKAHKISLLVQLDDCLTEAFATSMPWRIKVC
jgi:hypothetical protein